MAYYYYRESLEDQQVSNKREHDWPQDGRFQQEIYGRAPTSDMYELRMVQQGEYTSAVRECPKPPQKRVYHGKNNQNNKTQGQPRKSANWALYPPPVIEVVETNGKSNHILNCNPNFFAYATLIPAVENERKALQKDELIGSRSSSLHRIPNTESGYFVFGDVHVKHAGRYYLHFDMLEMIFDPESCNNYVIHRASIESDTFIVLDSHTKLPAPPKHLTPFTDSLIEAGVRLRCRRAPQKPKTKSKDSYESNLGQEVASSGATVQPPASKRRRAVAATIALELDTNEPTTAYQPQFWGAPQYGPAQPEYPWQGSMQNFHSLQNDMESSMSIATRATEEATMWANQIPSGYVPTTQPSHTGHPPLAQNAHYGHPLMTQPSQFGYPTVTQPPNAAANAEKAAVNPDSLWDPDLENLMDPDLLDFPPRHPWGPG